jgi:hypothetical protein
MELEHAPEVASENKKPTASENLHTVTPVSKYLAMLLFVLLPFIGGWIGYNYTPVKVIEVEKIVEIEKLVEIEVEKADQEVLLEGEAKLKVYINPIESPKETLLVGSDFCPVPKFQTADLTIAINGQEMVFKSIGVPVVSESAWPEVPFSEMVGMAIFENTNIELTPVIGVGENTLFIPDYDTMTVSEFQNGDRRYCDYEFSDFSVVYYYGQDLLEDLSVGSDIKLDKVVNMQKFYEKDSTSFKLNCFNGCG